MKWLAAFFLGGAAATILLLISIARSGAPAPIAHYREDDDGIQPMDRWLEQLPWLAR